MDEIPLGTVRIDASVDLHSDYLTINSKIRGLIQKNCISSAIYQVWITEACWKLSELYNINVARSEIKVYYRTVLTLAFQASQ